MCVWSADEDVVVCVCVTVSWALLIITGLLEVKLSNIKASLASGKHRWSVSVPISITGAHNCLLIASLFLAGLGPLFFSLLLLCGICGSHHISIWQIPLKSQWEASLEFQHVAACFLDFPRVSFIYSVILPSTPFNRNSRGRGYDCGVYDKLLNMSLEKQRKRKGYTWKGREREREQ